MTVSAKWHPSQPPLQFCHVWKTIWKCYFLPFINKLNRKKENESAAFSYEKQGLLSWYTIETKKSLGVLNSESLLKMLKGVKLINSEKYITKHTKYYISILNDSI